MHDRKVSSTRCIRLLSETPVDTIENILAGRALLPRQELDGAFVIHAGAVRSFQRLPVYLGIDPAGADCNGMQIGIFIVDFYCADKDLVLEVDGSIHETQVEEDANRQEFLEQKGLQVLRFMNDEVLGDLGTVLKKIRDALSP